STAYRFRKFSRRNRVALATVALVAVSLVLGTLASTWQAIRATRAEGLAEARLVAETKARTEADVARAAEAEQRRLAQTEQSKAEEQRAIAEAERAKADAQRAVAEANYQKAREAVDKYFTLVSESKLLDVPGLQPLRKELLEAALLFYQGAAVQRTDDPVVLADLAVTYLRVAIICLTVDRSDETVAALNQALDVIDRLRSEFPNEQESLRRVGGYWKGDRPTQQSIELPTNARAALQTLTRQTKTWEALASQFPDNAGFRSDLAATYFWAGNLLASGGQAASGVHYYARAKPLLVQLTQEFPDHPEHRADLARVHEHLARNLPPAGHPAAAEAESGAGLILRERLVTDFPQSPQYRRELGVSIRQHLPYMLKQNPAEAVKLARRLIELGENLVREYPNVGLYRSELFVWKRAAFAAIGASGQEQAIREALPQLDEVIAQLSKDSDSRNLNALAWNLAVSADVDERIADAAVRAAQQACELVPRTASYLNTLGVAQYRKRDYNAAVESLGRSRNFDANMAGVLPATDCYFLAMAQAQLGDGELAEKWFRAADLCMALFAATNAELKTFRQEAVDLIGVEAGPMSSKSLTPETEQELMRLCLAADPQCGWMHHWMGARQAERGQWSDADEHLTQAAASLSESQIALFRHALVRLKLADEEGYRRACATMCERFGPTDDLAESHVVAWTCGLGRDAVADMPVPLTLAQRYSERVPQDPGGSCTLGLVLFRCGRYDDAALQFTKCTAALESHKGSTFSVIYPRILLAVTHWHLGDKDEANTWLSAARSGFEQEPLSGMTWHRRAIVELLLAEAEQTISAGN
ncbi:MAG TPA: hypothetical protein VFW87_25080, partial [Pirellulales bacterium]|nr:hypothetical protein [Pirellulales bacterium]